MASSRDQKWAIMPQSTISPANQIGDCAIAKKITTAKILKPELVTERKRTSKTGEWISPYEFRYQPRTVLPTSRDFPFNGNASWNGSEIFSMPRASQILRESGFDSVEILILEHFHLIPLIRSLKARFLVTIISGDNLPGKSSPEVVRQRWTEVAEDSDILVMEKSVRLKVKLQTEPPCIMLFDENDANWARNIFQQLNEISSAC